ncbi:hypothetical protein T11_7487 [Trichinella zimbabwensis]|uniref:Uncharacterized protein n=1 Tax=Trichinella zimbabwensis TaxID=268475 RepID=A0A0V1DPH3_9BILA|nr:hypothetical protein T11_7487 [Trichinella zimbabwensis]
MLLQSVSIASGTEDYISLSIVPTITASSLNVYATIWTNQLS